VVIMDQDVAAALAAIEARLTRIEVRGREVERTVGIRFEDPEPEMGVVGGDEGQPIGAMPDVAGDLVLAEGVDTAEGAEDIDAMVALSPEEIDAALADLVAREGEVPFSDAAAPVVVDEAGHTLAGGEG
jgi:hypothetical protein